MATESASYHFQHSINGLGQSGIFFQNGNDLGHVMFPGQTQGGIECYVQSIKIRPFVFEQQFHTLCAIEINAYDQRRL